MNRKQAKDKGLGSYPASVPCKRGHMDERLVSNGACAECERIRKRSSSITDLGRQLQRERSHRWRLNNPDSYLRSLDRAKNWRERNPEKARISKERCEFKKLGIPEAYLKPAKNCQICGKIKEDNGSELAFDHCHKMNVFRGWLCRTCNTGIGILGDDFDSVYRAAQYLADFEFKRRE